MIVISKTSGPKYNGSEIGCLTPGKEYEAIEISYQINHIWVKKELTYNPEDPKFYIKVIDVYIMQMVQVMLFINQ